MKNNYTFAKFFAAILVCTFTNLFYSQTYCSPSYSSGCSSWRITQVAIPQAGFDNTFAAGTCTTGRDRTSVTVNLMTATNYNINITTVGWIACGMAIDFNKDGDFDDAGEILYLPDYLANATQTYSGTFIIPSAITAGTYRMRIWNRLANSGGGNPVDSACGTYAYGTWTDYTANISGVLGTSEVNKTTAKIYPNPASDVLQIESKNTIESVSLYNADGRLIKTIPQKSKSASISLTDLAPGIYNATIKDNKEIQTLKFIKK